MNSQQDLIKYLCNVFKLTEIEWLPSSVVALLLYLLENPSSSVDGDILFLNIEKQKTSAQLLTIIAAKGEIIVEKPVVFFHEDKKFPEHNLSLFLEKEIIPYATELGIYNDELLNINLVILLDDEEQIIDVNELTNSFWGAVPIITPYKSPDTFIKELSVENYSGQTFNSVLLIYPKHFYIEKKRTDSLGSKLELIPFATDSFALNINQRYKIFSFTADSEYNLAEEKNLLRVKVYEKHFSNIPPAATSDPQLILDQTGQTNCNQTIINIYLNLALDCLEVDYSNAYPALSAPDDIRQELQKRHQIGYDFIRDNQLADPHFISDFGLHLQQGVNMPVSSQYISKTVYFKALALLSLLSGKK